MRWLVYRSMGQAQDMGEYVDAEKMHTENGTLSFLILDPKPKPVDAKGHKKRGKAPMICIRAFAHGAWADVKLEDR